VYAVFEACGFGFTLQRQLTALGIHCYVVCPQKLDERNKRVKTDGLDAKALCLKLDRFVQGNRDALAIVRVPTEEEEQARAIHRQREQLVGGCANDRKLRDAVSWSITDWSRCKTGGSHAPLPRSQCHCG
jgi:transposase